ncbi:MAG: LuxR C-terminal-related transcriptional regulator [Bacteroidota bacterium]|jgi:DNA-binding NarL/FixJ family response regulator
MNLNKRRNVSWGLGIQHPENTTIGVLNFEVPIVPLQFRICLNKSMSRNRPISVVIADTAFIVRKGLKAMIAENPQFQFITEAENDEILIEALDTHHPDVLIVDHCCDDCFSIGFIEEIKNRFPEVHILVISHEKTLEEINSVIGIGIHNYLLKDCDETEITEAIVSCAQGEQYYCGQILDVLLEKENDEATQCATGTISEREKDIVRELVKGKRPKEIAELLNISHYTVTTHRKNIYKKLGINHSYELARFALKTGIQ